jgi:integral membrane protein (TIGR01906 family)
MNKWMIRIIAAATGIACLLALALTAVQLVAFDRARYAAAYEQYGRAEAIGISEDDLMAVTDRLLDYLKGQSGSLDMEAKIQGVIQPVFGERELLHMADVQHLFMVGFAIRRWAVIIAACGVVLLLATQKRRALYMLSWGYLAALGCFFLFAAVVGAAMAVNFNHAFTIFHQLLFTNDLWLLDPRTDVLIQMFPEAFFEQMAVGILGWMSASVLLPAVPAAIYGIHRRRKTRKHL